TGIERVVRAQLIELLKNPPKGYRVEPIYLTDEGEHWHYKYARKFTANILGLDNIGLEDEAIDYYECDILYAPDLSSMVINAHKADLYKKMKAKHVSINFLVHDILPISNPEFFPEGAKKTHEDWVDAISSVSDNLICVSKSVADELISYLKSQNKLRDDLNITYIHNGADIENSVPTKGLPQDHERVLGLLTSKPSFLMVGTIEPRKGHLQTIKAFEILWQKGLDINLVIVGKEGWMVEYVIDLIRTHNELNKRLFWLSGISDEYLEKIYASSTCFIMASEGEGFGLPIIEAARHKLPIIARNIPVFREIAGDSAYYFQNDKSPQTLANTIENWLNLYKENKHPKPDGIKYITWKENVKRLLEVLLGGE
ncbi:MAG: glycosyltransferase family 1 protein, partial [Hydrogenobaculum sp.]